MDDDNVVEVIDLVKSYSGRRVVDGVSFSVRRGTVFALLGPNGAGKTTTIEIMECIRPLTSGTVRVLGYSVGNRRDEHEIKMRIGIMPQDFRALDKLTVRENLELFARLYNRLDGVDEAIREFGLEEHSSIQFEKLSGGLRQRVGLAIATINDPEVLFLDEPTTGLDPASRKHLWEMIRRLKHSGKTILLTSHYMEEVEQLADQVAVMNRGRIVAIGSPYEIAGRYGMGRRLIIKGYSRSRELASLATPENTHGDMLVLKIDGSVSVAEMVDIAVRDGLDVQFRNPSLEDAFLRLVGKMDEHGRLVAADDTIYDDKAGAHSA